MSQRSARSSRAALLAVGMACAVTSLTLLTLLAPPPATARPDPPSEEKIEQSQERVEERATAVERIEQKLAEARQRLEPLTTKVDRLVKRYYREQAALARARQKYQTAKERLAAAERRVEQARESVAALAAQRYRSGGGLRRLGAMLDADGPQDLADRMAGLRVVARERKATLDRMRSAQVVADVVRKQAKEALADQQAAIAQVEQAKKSAQEAVRQQRAEIERIQRLKSTLEEKLADARARSNRLEREREDYLDWRRQQRQERREARAQRQAEAREAAREARQAAAEATREVAEATGNDCEDKPVSLGSYANGLIPPQALCPLPQDGHMLRADAAAAFMRLNAAYADHFGEPICVTDSYRSLAVQQRLAQRKPELAAEPGTSNHGWGIAVDLCGGINSFDTPQHEWMLANAPEYGWISPEWARPDGSMPEPWHWEYTG